MFKVFGFYKFVKVKSLKKNKDFLQKFLISNHIRGTIIIAKEGLNGSISGGVKDIDKIIKKLKFLFSFKKFDNRISLKHGLKLGSYSMCSGCRMPISSKDKRSNKYEEGVSCPNCYDKLTETQKSRFRMRQSQIYKAKLSGKKYIFQKIT